MARYLAIALSAWVAAAAAVQAQQTPPAAGSDGVPVPRRVRSVQPAYPPEAAAAGLRGIVILELTIDTAGKVTDVRVVRSVPPFDEAAVTAARRWEYEPSVVGGHPSPVRLTVPVTFSLRLPEVERQPGIPELRAGGLVQYPPKGKGKGSAVVTITMSPSGDVLEVQPASGDGPFVEALQQAAQSWRFAGIDGEETASFRLEGEFAAGDSGGPGRVSLRLTGFQRELPLTASARITQAGQGAGPAPTQPATPHATASPITPVAPSTAATPANATSPLSTPAPAMSDASDTSNATTPALGPAAESTSSPSTASASAMAPSPEPMATTPTGAAPKLPSPAANAPTLPDASARTNEAPLLPAGTVAQPPPSRAKTPTESPDNSAAPGTPLPASPGPKPAPRPALPAVETVSAPPPPTRIVEAGASAVRDIRFDGQIPDLVRGRRPMSPPLARISGISGDVTVSFSVDAAGVTLVRAIEGPETLKKGTQELVASWLFRRLSPERIFLSAVVSYKGDTASAVIRPQAQ